MEKLAIHGGPVVKQTPFTKGKRFGLEEARHLLEALEQNTLFYHFGTKVKAFLDEFNKLYGTRFSVATSSGTGALHTALGAAGITVGDEIITSPVTDHGTMIGILYQNAVPVFADLNPYTYNMDPASVEAKITKRTKAIIVVHLAGNPCDMDPLMEIARKHRLKVIEDCAQSYLATYKGRLLGTIGDYGCFSTNDFKHISTGDGGIVTVNSGDEQDYYHVHAFADKNYKRLGPVVSRDIASLAPNYRMTELQGAVGIAQVQKLQWICERRYEIGEKISEGLRDLDGIDPPQITDGGKSTYWFYMLRVDETELGCSRNEFSAALKAEGIPNEAGYIPKVLYLHELFQSKRAYPESDFPFGLHDITYAEGDCPHAEKILQSAIKIPISEFYSEQDVEDIIQAIRKVASYYHK